MSRLFKRFSQATSKTHIDYGGSGLGLYICRELAEKQGGGVGVASCPGQGSVFAFYIETRAAAPPEQVPPDLSNLAPKPSNMSNITSDLLRRTHSRSRVTNGTTLSEDLRESPQSSTPRHQEDFHILLVEDNLVNQKVLAKQLQKAKCNVTVANHGAEALGILEQADCWRKTQLNTSQLGHQAGLLRIDVVLMDVEMPIMDGLQCTRHIRRLEDEGQITRHLPIIAVTANVRQEQKDTALAAGVDSVLSKPFTVSEVLVRIRELLA